MANSFLAAAGKKTTDIRGFLRNARGGNSIKYRAESGKKHLIYVPYREVDQADENGNVVKVNSIVAIFQNVHDWTDRADKYHAHVCLKGTVVEGENGEYINDGNCPFCDRVQDAWDIYRYRYELEERTCGKTGTELQKHMEKIKGQLADERKSKEAKSYIYLLVVLFKTDGSNKPVIGQDGMPEYELKVMKLSDKRSEKIQTQLENAGTDLAGCELIFDYPKDDDIRQVVGQSTTSPVFTNNMLTEKYKGLKDKINADVEKFCADEWDGLDKAFQEWSEMSTKQATAITNELYAKWDEYKAAKKKAEENGQDSSCVRYLEYGGEATPASNPSLGVTQNMSGGVQMPNVNGVGGQDSNGMPQLGGVPDVNALFSGDDMHI